jgi:hypothetical protein
LSGAYIHDHFKLLLERVDVLAQAKSDGLVKAYEESGLPFDEAAFRDVKGEVVDFCHSQQRRVSTTLRQVFTKFSEFFICCQFPQESSHQDRLGTTIANSVDLRHACFCPSWEPTSFFQSRSLLAVEWKPAC